MKSQILFEEDDHKWVVIGRDENKDSNIIDTNEYAIITKGKGLILDPGGIDIFPQLLAELIKYVKTENIVGLFASHQDPDIISSLPMWLDLNDQVKTYTPWVWKGFISHFSMGHSDCIVSLKDSGGKIPIGDTGREVIAVPAHYCHSPGNFSIYDPIADILFSGDIGAALLPDANVPLFVENFDDHIQYMEAFHVRWMPSSEALKNWARRVRELNPKMICPQHGSIFKGKDVTQFLTWIENLTVGKY